MVACLVRVEEVVGSNPATPTRQKKTLPAESAGRVFRVITLGAEPPDPRQGASPLDPPRGGRWARNEPRVEWRSERGSREVSVGSAKPVRRAAGWGGAFVCELGLCVALVIWWRLVLSSIG